MCRKPYRPSPATQWTATQLPGSSWNVFFNKLNQSSTSLFGGGAPSSKGQSWKRNHTLDDPARSSSRVLLSVVCFSPPQWCHLFQVVIYHKWCHTLGPQSLLHNASGPGRAISRQLCVFDCYLNVTGAITNTMPTSMKDPSVLSVGLWVIRNLMFLWVSSTGAGRFMVANWTYNFAGWPLTLIYHQEVVNIDIYIGPVCWLLLISLIPDWIWTHTGVEKMSFIRSPKLNNTFSISSLYSGNSFFCAFSVVSVEKIKSTHISKS